MTARKSYTEGFKREAVRLAKEHRDITAQDLGVSDDTLHAWKKQFEQTPADAFPGDGNSRDKELAQMMRALRERWRKLKQDMLPPSIAVCGIVLLPVLIPLACIVTEGERMRMREIARRTTCVGCNELLGEAGIDAAFRESRGARERIPGFVNFRRTAHVICTKCGKRYIFSKDENRLTEVAA